MTSSRPYLLKAIYEWISDNHLTPYLLVDALQENVQVPQQFVEDGKIVLNISLTAVRNLELEKDYISFNARFSGQPMQVYIPMTAALAIYAAENGQGMVFPEEVSTPPQAAEESWQNNTSGEAGDAAGAGSSSGTGKQAKKTKPRKKPPFLKVVK